MRYRAVMLASVLVGAIGVVAVTPSIRHHFSAISSTAVTAAPPHAGTGARTASRATVSGGGTDTGTKTGPEANADLTNRTGGAGGLDPGAVTEPAPSDHSVSVNGTVFFGWSLMDRATGAITGSANRERGTNSTESMIKAWIASDYLRRLAASGGTPTKATLRELTLMIIDSNDNMAQKYYAIDGYDSVVTRLVSMCGLTRTRIYRGWWSKTRMTPADAVRYGDCVADGRAAGKVWTPWILKTMTHVRGGIADQQAKTGGGHWGIITALPPEVAGTTSIKNGWTAYDGVWHVNCLAIQRTWVLSVMMRYPAGAGLTFGAGVCASVTRQLLGSDPAATSRGRSRAIPD